MHQIFRASIIAAHLNEKNEGMLKSLLSPKWQHPDVSTRKHAITNLDPHKPKQLKALQTVILEDAQAELRQLAITRIESIELLEQLNNQLREEDKPALEQRWGKLLAAQNQPLPDALPEAVLCSAINEAENEARRQRVSGVL